MLESYTAKKENTSTPNFVEVKRPESKSDLQTLKDRFDAISKTEANSTLLKEVEEMLVLSEALEDKINTDTGWETDTLVINRRKAIYRKQNDKYLADINKILLEVENASQPNEVAPTVDTEVLRTENTAAPVTKIEKIGLDSIKLSYENASQKYLHDLKLLKDAESKTDKQFLINVTRWLENSEKQYNQSVKALAEAGLDPRLESNQIESQIDELHKRLGWGTREGAEQPRLKIVTEELRESVKERINKTREDFSENILQRARRMAKVLSVPLLATNNSPAFASGEVSSVTADRHLSVEVPKDDIEVSNIKTEVGQADKPASESIEVKDSATSVSTEHPPKPTDVLVSEVQPIEVQETVETVDPEIEAVTISPSPEMNLNEVAPNNSLATSELLITPDAVQTYRASYKGGEDAWNRDFETFVRASIPQVRSDSWMSRWFSDGVESPGDIYQHFINSGLTVAEFNTLRDGDVKTLRHYLRSSNIPIHDFRALQDTLNSIGMSAKVQILDTMTLKDVFEGAFVVEHSNQTVNSIQ